MNGIPETLIVAATLTGFVVALAIAWLVGTTFRRVRHGGSAGMVFAGMVSLLVGAALVLGAVWGEVYLIDKHYFFADFKFAQLVVCILNLIWLVVLCSAFANGERGKRATDE